MKRRHFLQAAASTLTTLGLSQWDLMQQGSRYGKILAQDAPRKFALLVGINEYLQGSRPIQHLKGCQTDVALQQELLLHRFKFAPEDIVTLTDRQATRQNILNKFQTHLIAKAKPGDVVVFHFSGHGSRLLDPNPIDGKPYNSAFVPYDAGNLNPDGSVNDIMGRTLFLLMSALKTQNVTAVLDSCYSGGGTRGTVTIRSVRDSEASKPSPAELSYQETLRKQLNLSPQELQRLRQESAAKGAVFAATLPEQTAEDRQFPDGFHAGAFTYLLTQYLWSQTADIGNAQQFLKTALPKLTGYQIPSFDLAQPTGTTQPLYFIPPKQRTAQAVITQVTGSQADIWLGGLDYITLSALAPGSTFALLDEAGQNTGQVTLNSRQGLTARATVPTDAQLGTLLRETSRVIPNDFRMRIGLDLSLGNELAAIQAELEQLGRVKAVLAQTGERLYPEGIDYIFSRVTPAYQALIKQIKQGEQPQLNSVALFAPNLELIPNSSGQAGESAQAAIKRLYPKLQSLIAAQLVRQTLNANTSNLKVDVQINLQNQPEFIVAKAGSLGGQGSDSSPVRSLSLNTPIQFQLANQDTTPLYFLVMLVNPDGQLEILFPNLYTLGNLKTISQVLPKTHRLVPNPNQGDAFTLAQNMLGRSEVLVIASPKPLDTAFKQLQTLVSEQPQQNPFRTSRSTDAIADLLSNLGTRTSQSSYTLSNNDLVSLSIPFEVIPNKKDLLH